MRILIVDDDAETVETVGTLVKVLAPTAEVLGAASGRLAQDVARRAPVSVVLVDAHMPGLSGGEVLRWFRDYSPGTYRLMMSGYSNPPGIELAHDFIPKPFASQELAEKLQNRVPTQQQP